MDGRTDGWADADDVEDSDGGGGGGGAVVVIVVKIRMPMMAYDIDDDAG